MARNDAELEAIFGKLPFVNYTVLDGLINPTFIAEPWPNFANIVVVSRNGSSESTKRFADLRAVFFSNAQSWGLDAILAGILATQFL